MATPRVDVDPKKMLHSSSPDLERIRVGDCMHSGIVACDPQAPLAEVAALMARHRVHAVALSGDRSRPQAIVSALDVIAATDAAGAGTAREIAGTEALSISSDRSLRDAARMMTEHAVAHLIVVDRSSGHPVGVLSSTDIIAAYARASNMEVTA